LGEDEKATALYMKTVPRWSDDQLKLFVQVLKETGNRESVEIFTADDDTTLDQVGELLRIQMKMLTEQSGYEGLSMEDETVAKTVRGYLNEGKFLFKDCHFNSSSRTVQFGS